MEFEPEEKRIIRTLYAASKPLTTNRISEKADMAWLTAKKYLHILHKRKIVEGRRHGNAVYWWLKV